MTKVLKTEKEANEYVLKLADRCNDIIVSETMKLDPEQRFLIYGRTVNYLFQRFYKFSVIASKESDDLRNYGQT